MERWLQERWQGVVAGSLLGTFINGVLVAAALADGDGCLVWQTGAVTVGIWAVCGVALADKEETEE